MGTYSPENIPEVGDTVTAVNFNPAGDMVGVQFASGKGVCLAVRDTASFGKPTVLEKGMSFVPPPGPADPAVVRRAAEKIGLVPTSGDPENPGHWVRAKDANSSQASLPRCPNLDGSSLRIATAYTVAGQFTEANAVTITDGERSAVYVPQSVRSLTDEQIAALEAHFRARYTGLGFAAGDRVLCRSCGSWVDGKEGTITALNVTSSDGITGHAVQIEGVGYTVLDPAKLEPAFTPPAVVPAT